MASKSTTLSVLITGNAKGLQTAGKHAEGALGGIGAAAARVGGGIANVAKTAAVGVAAIGTIAIGFGSKAISMASNVDESLSKVNTVFGKSGADIDAWSKTTASSMGLSRGAALDAAGGFGNMFTQMGLTGDAAAKLSKGQVGLAADFASFHNADITDVLDAQSAAFRGEYDSIQKYVPMLNGASVEQRALQMSGKKTTKELTAQDKALAVNALMFEGGGAAIGDFAKTSGGLANKTRILKAKLADLTAQIGAKLLPIASKVASFFADRLIPAFERFTKSEGFLKFIKEVTGGFRAFVGAFKAGDGDITSAGFPGFMERVAFVARKTFNWIKENVPPILKAVAGFIREQVIPALGRLAGWIQEKLVPAIGTMVASFQERVWPVLHDKVIPVVQEVARILVEYVAPAVGVLVEWIVAKLIPAVFILVEWIATKLIPKIAEVVESIINFGIKVWEFVDGPIAGIISAIGTVIGVITSIATTIFNAGKEIGEKLWAIVSKFAEWNLAVVGFITDAISWLVGIPGKIADGFVKVYDFITDPFVRAFAWIKDKWDSSVGFIFDKISSVGGFVGGLIPGRAGGGPVTAGMPYVVGENGPELFIPPGGGGAIAPTGSWGGRGGGGTTIVNNIYIKATAPTTAGREVTKALNAYARSGGRS